MASKSCTQQHLELLASGYIRQLIGFKKVSTIIYQTVYNYSERKHIAIGLCGSFRSGKSTLGGRMYYEFNHRNHTKSNLKNNDEERIPHSTDEQWRTYFDEAESEQIRQMTIHGNIHEMFTMSYQISLIDTPGYKQYIKNYIRYICQSDVVILVFAANDLMEKPALSHIPSTPNVDKVAFDGYYQLLDKLRICHLFEIQQLIIVINKLDKYNYSKQKFIECKSEIEKLLKFVGYQHKNKFPVIPISAMHGDNISFRSSNEKLKWWTNDKDGGYRIERSRTFKNIKHEIGYTVYDAIEAINFTDIKMYNKDNILNIKPFKMSICNIYDEIINGSVVSGRIENGRVNIGTIIKCFPSGCYGQIKSIEMFNKKAQSASYGDIVGISLDSFLLHPMMGDIIINENNTKEYEVTGFEALIDIYPSNDKLNKKYTKGYSPLILTNNSVKCQCRLSHILWKLNKNIKQAMLATTNGHQNGNGKMRKFQQKLENPNYLEAGDTAKVLFEPNRQFPISASTKIIILEHQQVVMCGKVTKLHHADEVTEDFDMK